MPLTGKGEKIKSAMARQYGPEKGEKVFYASKNAGKISGVDEKDCNEMNEGSEGLKTYGDTEKESQRAFQSEDKRRDGDEHHHEIQAETGPEIEDKRRDAGMGLVHAKEETEASHADYPKPMDSQQNFTFPREFPNDPFGDKMPDGGFKYENVWSAAEMKNSPFAIYKE